MNISILQLKTLNTIVEEGSFQAGAKKLYKTHPSLISSIKKLEESLGFSVFCRKEYRLKLTKEGELVHNYAKKIINLLNDLENESSILRDNTHPKVNIVIGDVTPNEVFIDVLGEFIENNKFVDVNIEKENIYAPNEKLLKGEADIIIHHIDDSCTNIEYKKLKKINIIPVISYKLLRKNNLDNIDNINYKNLSKLTQCVIKDTRQEKNDKKGFFIINNAESITVNDQDTKKNFILNGVCWGHMPEFLVSNELNNGSLVSLKNNYIKGKEIDICIARLAKPNYRPIENKIWSLFNM